MTEKSVDLGFLDKCEPWLLVNTFFPSKVGGRPAWLDVESIPNNDRLKCPKCGKQLAFLCQVNWFYSSHAQCVMKLCISITKIVNLISIRCMPRWTSMTFVFIEPSMFSFVWIRSVGSRMNHSMYCFVVNAPFQKLILVKFAFSLPLAVQSTIKVFRCQLPRENKYYKPTPPNEDEPEVISNSTRKSISPARNDNVFESFFFIERSAVICETMSSLWLSRSAQLFKM